MQARFSPLYFFMLLTLLFAFKAHAVDFPKGCESKGFDYEGSNLVLNLEGKQTLYLVQNQSNKKIRLERKENEEAFMTPKLRANLNPYRWGAFASDVQNLQYSCYVGDADNASQINCQDVLTVCQYPRVKFALSNMGNYWVSTNQSQQEVIRNSIRKGILLRW